MPVSISGSGPITGVTSVASAASNTAVQMTDLAGASATCQAWLNYNGSTATIRGSFNVSSVTKNSGGNYTVNMNTALADTNYAVNVTADGISSGYIGAFNSAITKTTTVFGIQSFNVAGSSVDTTTINASVFR
jgi:hypothetical protein